MQAGTQLVQAGTQLVQTETHAVGAGGDTVGVDGDTAGVDVDTAGASNCCVLYFYFNSWLPLWTGVRGELAAPPKNFVAIHIK